MNINNKLFDLIKSNNTKQNDLANYLNVKSNVITNWKNRGTDPPANMIVPICEFFNISINEFLESNMILSENEKEMLHNFKQLPEREQIKFIARLEDKIKELNTKEGERIG